MSVFEVFLQLRWLQICVGENNFIEHALTMGVGREGRWANASPGF